MENIGQRWISGKDREIIYHGRKTTLFDEKGTKMKKQRGFVTVETYNGTEECELVGIYMLFLLSEKYNTKVLRLYHGDGLVVKINKNIQKIFKENKSNIIIQCNVKIVTWTLVSSSIIRLVSLTTNLITKPFHKNSNHPPSILKQNPKLIEKRNSILLSN